MLMFYLSALPNERDKQAFEKLYAEHSGIALRAAMRVCGNKRELAEDAVHDAFMRIIDDWENFSKRSCNNWRALIVTIAKNRAIDLLRKDKKSVPLDSEDIGNEGDFTVIFERKESEEYLASCISKLPERYRTVLELRYFHDISNPEIAKYLGITVNNVAVRISRATSLFAEIVKNGGYYDDSKR